MRILLTVLLICLSLPGVAMNKAELVDAIAKDAGLSKADAKRALESMAKRTGQNLKRDGVSLLPEVGVFVAGRGKNGNCSLQADGDDGCILFHPAARGEAAAIDLYIGNYLADVMNDHALLQELGCADGEFCPHGGRAALTVPSHRSLLEMTSAFNVGALFLETGQLDEVSAFLATSLAGEMKSAGGDAALAKIHTVIAMNSLADRAREATLLRKEIQTLQANGAEEDFTLQVSRRSGVSADVLTRVYESITNHVNAALKKGDRVALVGFGSFSVSQRAARTGRNPQTGKEIQIAAKNVVKFKAGADLSKKVN